jgi:hypothetical protein
VRLGSVVTVVGALVAIVGSIGTWIHLSEGGFSQSFGGFSDGRDGPYVMGLAVVVGAIAVSRFVTARARWLGWVGLALSMILLLVGISDASDVHDRVSAFLAEVPGTSGGVGWGLWLAVAGGAISLLGSALLIDIRRRD